MRAARTGVSSMYMIVSALPPNGDLQGLSAPSED